MQLLERQYVKDGSNPCIFRIAQEGLPFLLPYVTKQRVSLPLAELKALLQQRALKLPRSVPYKTFQAPTSAPAGAVRAHVEGSNEEAPDAVAVPTSEPQESNGDAAAAAAAGGCASNDGAAHGIADGATQASTVGGAAPAAGSALPVLQCEEACKQVAEACAGCCIVLLRCAYCCQADCTCAHKCARPAQTCNDGCMKAAPQSLHSFMCATHCLPGWLAPRLTFCCTPRKCTQALQHMQGQRRTAAGTAH